MFNEFVSRRSEKHKIRKDNESYNKILELMKISNNLYNHANYIIKQRFFSDEIKEGENRLLTNYDIDKLFKDIDEENYRALPAQTAQAVLKVLFQNWKSYIRLLKMRKNSELESIPKPPSYRRKGDYYNLWFTNQQCKIKNGIITFPKALEGLYLDVKTNANSSNLSTVTLYKKKDYILAVVVYKRKSYVIDNKIDVDEYIRNLKDEEILGIDIGKNNLIATSTGLLIDGKGLNNYNNYYNSIIKNEQSKLYHNNKKYTSNKINNIHKNRYNYIKDKFHKISRKIVNECLDKNIKAVIIPKFDSLLEKSTINIPYSTLYSIIEYKLNENGIVLKIINDESYTSKTSFIDGEIPNKFNSNEIRRINRGLFLTNNEIKINSDINAANQMIKKVKESYNVVDRYSKNIINPKKIYVN